MLETIRKTILRYDLIPPESTVVIGVSGGADSLALLHALHRLSADLRFRLHVATLDHMTRGADSAADAQFVVDLCHAWGIPVTMQQIDVPARAAQHRVGLESMARTVRYSFFDAVAAQVGARHIAVAHQREDQAETVLMHALRGSGLRGLGGMAYKSLLYEDHFPNDQLYLIRPLLNVRRTEIEAYCHAHDLTPRSDATNTDIEYTRNYLRHEIMPRLHKLNPQVSEALARLGTIADTEDDYLEQQLQSAIQTHGGGYRNLYLTFAREPFRRLHLALQRRWIIWAYHKVNLGGQITLAYERVQEAVRIASQGDVGAVVQFPGGVRLIVSYQQIAIEGKHSYDFSVGATIGEQDLLLIAPDQELTLTVPGEVALLAGYRLRAAYTHHADTHAQINIPTDALVTLRARRSGDRFAPPGLGGHTTKLTEWMVDRKIPRVLRDQIPLLLVNGVIAAILWGERWVIAHPFIPSQDRSTVYLYVQLNS